MSGVTKDTVQRQFARQLVSKIFARAGMPAMLSYGPAQLLATLETALAHFLEMVDEMRRGDMPINTGKPGEPDMSPITNANVVRYLYLRECATRPEVETLLTLNPNEWDEYLDGKIAAYLKGT